MADGQDLSYVQVELLDKDGTLVQHADRHVKASIKGEGRLVGFISSDLRRKTPFTSHEDKTYFGRAMAIVQSTRKAGTIRLRFDVEGWDEPVWVKRNGFIFLAVLSLGRSGFSYLCLTINLNH